MVEHTQRTGGVEGFGKRSLTNEELFALDVDVLIPAAIGHVIHEGNATKVRAKAIVEAANMPVTMEAMDILEQRGVAVVPDILANAGGVIASMEDLRSLSAIKMAKEDVLRIVRDRIGENLDLSIKLSRELGISITEAATQLAVERVYEVMGAGVHLIPDPSSWLPATNPEAGTAMTRLGPGPAWACMVTRRAPCPGNRGASQW